MKPMVYTKQNVLAFLDDRKFNSRRLGGLKEINAEPDNWEKLVHYIKQTGLYEFNHKIEQAVVEVKPKYQVGDECYVAEGYQIKTHHCNSIYGKYLADNKEFVVNVTDRERSLIEARKKPFRKTSGRFMYKSLARITYKITEAGAEWLPDITPKDCTAEGIILIGDELVFNNQKQKDNLRIKKFYRLWKSIHGADSWNRWVWVYKWDEIKIGE